MNGKEINKRIFRILCIWSSIFIELSLICLNDSLNYLKGFFIKKNFLLVRRDIILNSSIEIQQIFLTLK